MEKPRGGGIETAAFFFLLWAELVELVPVSSEALGDPTGL